MTKFLTRCCGVATLALALSFIGGGFGSASVRHSAPLPLLKSLTIAGTTLRPVFVLTGSGLKMPAASPPGGPGTRRLCRLHIGEGAGRDYGNAFYLTVYAGPHGRRLFGAGRYHPQSDELDCIGLVVLSHTPRRISFTLGAAYLRFTYPHLRNGLRVRLVLLGSTITRLVHSTTLARTTP